jgi:hypothetical protein
MLYTECPALSEGDLAKRRASLVSTVALAEIARGIGLGEHLRLGRGEELTGGRDKSSILADTVEAIIGAVYLGTVALIFHALALYMRPKEQKRAPRAVHIVLGAVLVILLLAILSVFWGGGVVDPEDIWIIGWIAAIAALALYRAFRKR